MLARHLDEAFGGWGDERTFDRWYRRPLGPVPTDVLVLRRGRELLAGVCLVFRQLQAPDGSEHLGVVLSGAWTAPAARGQGCFTRLLRDLRPIAADRGAGVVLALTSAGRASEGALARAADAIVPTWWLTSPGAGAGTPALDHGAALERALTEVVERRRAARGAVVALYAPEDLARHVRGDGRPAGVVTAAGSTAVVTRGPSGDRVEALVGDGGRWPALEALGAASQGLSLFTTRPDDAAGARARGWHCGDGRLHVLAADRRWTQARWALEGLDRA